MVATITDGIRTKNLYGLSVTEEQFNLLGEVVSMFYEKGSAEYEGAIK